MANVQGRTQTIQSLTSAVSVADKECVRSRRFMVSSLDSQVAFAFLYWSGSAVLSAVFSLLLVSWPKTVSTRYPSNPVIKQGAREKSLRNDANSLVRTKRLSESHDLVFDSPALTPIKLAADRLRYYIGSGPSSLPWLLTSTL